MSRQIAYRPSPNGPTGFHRRYPALGGVTLQVRHPVPSSSISLTAERLEARNEKRPLKQPCARGNARQLV